MFCRMCRLSHWWREGEVVEILERRGVRRAKIVAAGTLIEVAAVGGGEIHLGDRVTFDAQRAIRGAAGSTGLDIAVDVESDTDINREW